jgi:MFS transporter, DHA2 family, multidrug resistance protein
MATQAAQLPGTMAVAPAARTGLPSIPELIGFVLMTVGMFMAILDIQIVSASLREIQAGLSASSEEIVWVQSSYLIAEIVMIPLSGFLARGLSTRWLFVISSGGFTLASMLCATANSIETMVVYRILQGFLGGAMIPTIYSATFALFGRERQVGVTVAISLIVTMAPTVGPVLGGWITESFSWHWLFLVNVVPGILVTVGVALLVDIDKPDFALLKRIDVPGLIFMAVFLGGIEYVLEEGARKQWFEEDIITIMTSITIVAGILFFLRLATAKEPIVRLRPFANYNFAAGSILGGIVGLGLYGLSYLYPLYLSQVAQMTSGQIGNVLFVSGLCMALAAPVAAALSRILDMRVIAMLGLLILALSTWMTHGVTEQWRFDQFLVPQILRGVGLIFCMVSVSATAFATLPISMLKDGSGLFTLMRNLGGAVGLALINTVMQWRTSFHWNRAVEHISLSRPEVQAQIDAMTARAEGSSVAGDPATVAVALLGRMVMRQVQVLTFADCFLFMSGMFVIAALVPMLLRKPIPQTGAREAH